MALAQPLPEITRIVGTKGEAMNWDVLKGQWKQMTGKLKSKWGKLTDDDLTLIGGKKDELLGKLQERYGYSKDQAEKEGDDFLASMGQP
jgi:uncharacterized protein YjbJ (UPF0337 family)